MPDAASLGRWLGVRVEYRDTEGLIFAIEEEGGFNKAIEAKAEVKAKAEAKRALNLVARL